jgi:hypothetical protein
MAKKLTLYYDDELNSWIESVHFYLGEIHALGIRLDDIIARNSIVDIAAKVEVHQLLLNKINKKLADLLVEIKAQHAAVQKQKEEKADAIVQKALEKEVKKLAMLFKKLEREYVDIKYYCNEFLSEMLKK